MCGIFFWARCVDSEQSVESTNFVDVCERLRAANSLRGPDVQKTRKLSLEADQVPPLRGKTQTGLDLAFFASELQLRGSSPVAQPHEADGDIFCWNGEVFEGLEISPEENDGVELFRAIRALSMPDALPELLSTIEGPYAFVFHHSASQRLYFSRDPLGRRSLLIHKPTSNSPYFLLASVSAGPDPGYEFEELATEVIYSLDLRRLRQLGFEAYASCLSTLPRKAGSALAFAKPARVSLTLPPADLPVIKSLDHIPETLVQTVDKLIAYLDRSVMLQVCDIPSASVAKGRAKVAVLFSGGIDSTIIAYLAHRHIPLDEPIDLLNVAFENPRKIQAQNNPSGLTKQQKRAHSHTAQQEKSVPKTSYKVPDRVTGLQEVEELRRLCPERLWNFVEVNVPYGESQAAISTVEALMLPGRTVMDLSLASALYFASRGVGQIRNDAAVEYQPYTSSAKVLLNGLGSDELLGGYGRHRTAFNTGSWEAVVEALQIEIDRIPTRNLGRDDRVMSSHGKETRHPFLSLAVVRFLAELPVHLKMDPRADVGIGDKTLLRLAARKLGLIEASGRKKRAMQFGSHSARMKGERRGDVLLAD